MKPKVSVIIPVYNVESYLRECLDSVVDQTLKDIEIICVNDGSTDGSSEILQEYASQDYRIAVINKSNAGYGAAINDGIAAATGEYIGIVESDDYILSNMYEVLYSTATRFNLPDIVKSDFCRFWGVGKSRTFEHVSLSKKDAYYDRLCNPSADCGMLRTNGINPPGIYKRDFIVKNDIRLNETPGASYQDNGLWFQLFVFGETAVFVKEDLYMVRRDNPNSSVKSRGKVYAICDEYDFIRKLMLEKTPPCPHALEMCAVLRYGNYIWTIGRIDQSFRREFIWKFHDDFKTLENDGELSRYFFTPEQWNVVTRILEDPDEYFFTTWYDYRNSASANRIRSLEMELERSKRREKALLACNSYRIGRVVTSVPRFFKRLIRETRAADAASPSVRQPGASVCEAKPDATLAEETSLEDKLCRWYKRQTGEDLDLLNPVTFNQKIQWLKLYDSTPVKSQLADKYLVREWVAERIGAKYLIPLIGVWDSPDQIPFNSLGNSYVLKMNDSSGHNIVVEDASDVDCGQARTTIQKWFDSDFVLDAGYELHYGRIKPKILAEQYLYESPIGLTDYRFFCFDGEPYAIWVDVGSGTKQHRRDIYDLEWNLQPLLVSYANLSSHKPKPAKLNEMLYVARTLSQGFCHVRVDLYYIGGEVYFGEMTFTSQSGIGKWDPPEYNLVYGEQLKLPS